MYYCVYQIVNTRNCTDLKVSWHVFIVFNRYNGHRCALWTQMHHTFACMTYHSILTLCYSPRLWSLSVVCVYAKGESSACSDILGIPNSNLWLYSYPGGKLKWSMNNICAVILVAKINFKLSYFSMQSCMRLKAIHRYAWSFSLLVHFQCTFQTSSDANQQWNLSMILNQICSGKMENRVAFENLSVVLCSYCNKNDSSTNVRLDGWNRNRDFKTYVSMLMQQYCIVWLRIVMQTGAQHFNASSVNEWRVAVWFGYCWINVGWIVLVLHIIWCFC